MFVEVTVTSPVNVNRVQINACTELGNARHRRNDLTLDYTPGVAFWRGVEVMQIGIVAKKIGLSVDAIRFYERNALLPRAARTHYAHRSGSRQRSDRSEEHTSELQSRLHLVCRLLLEKKEPDS